MLKIKRIITYGLVLSFMFAAPAFSQTQSEQTRASIPFFECFTGVPDGEIPEGWTRDINNFAALWSSWAGGEPPEMWLDWTPPQQGVFYLTTLPINTSGHNALEFSFKNHLNHYSGPVTLRVVTIVGNEEYLVKEWVNPGNIEPYVFETILISGTHGVGDEEFRLAWVYEGDTYNIDWWNFDDIYLGETEIVLHTVTFNVMENSPDQDPVEGAVITIDNDIITTDENGIAFINLMDGNYMATIKAAGYEEEEVTFTVDGEEKNIEVYLMDDIVEPFNLKVITEDIGPGEAYFTWNVYDEYEFRYDDGTAVNQLGFPMGTMNSIMGAAHRYKAELEEITWYLTQQGGPHHMVNIWVFGLDENGFPDSNNLLYNQNNVPNTDNQWNLYEFSEPVEAPEGFLIGLSYNNGFLGLALDDGEGEPWEFVYDTQFAIFDYLNPSYSWDCIGAGGWPQNFLLRAYGANNGEIIFGPTAKSPGSEHKIKRYSKHSGREYIEPEPVMIPMDKPLYTGKPHSQPVNTRKFLGWNVFLNNEEIATEINDNQYLFTNVEEGKHTAAVQAAYTTGSSEIVEIDFEMKQWLFTVTFDVINEEGDPVEEAVITFNGITNQPGDYLFENIIKGTYDYMVEKEGYINAEDEVYVDENITIEVVLYPVLHTLTLVADPAEGGTVEGEGEYPQGKEATIKAIPEEEWMFIEWIGDITHVDDPGSATAIVTMPDKNISLTANFEKTPAYTLTLIPEPEEGGTVEGEGKYGEGEEIPITATPYEGWFFVEWTGDIEHVDDHTSAITIVTMPAGNITLIANFDTEPPQTYTLELKADPEEAGSVEGEGEYQAGEKVDIKATPVDVDWEFKNWTGDIEYVDDPEAATTIIVMPEKNISLTANFNFVSVEDISGVELSVYPNPARDEFYIESSEIIKQIRLIDISGQVVKDIAVDALNAKINVNNLRAGVYFIQIFTKEGLSTKRVQVTH